MIGEQRLGECEYEIAAQPVIAADYHHRADTPKANTQASYPSFYGLVKRVAPQYISYLELALCNNFELFPVFDNFPCLLSFLPVFATSPSHEMRSLGTEGTGGGESGSLFTLSQFVTVRTF